MDYIKHAVISAYNDEVEAIDRDIETAKAEGAKLNEYIKDFEDRKVALGKECTEVLKQMDEKGLPEIKTFEFSPGDRFEFTEKACEKTNNWIKKHELMYHTPEYLRLIHSYKACTPSNYELRIGWTDASRYVSLVCTECEKHKDYIRNYKYDIEEKIGQ